MENVDDSSHNYKIIKDDNDESNVEIARESTETGCEVHNKIFASKHKYELKDYANIDLENEWASFIIMRNKNCFMKKAKTPANIDCGFYSISQSLLNCKGLFLCPHTNMLQK